MALTLDWAPPAEALIARLRAFLSARGLNWEGAPERVLIAREGDIIVASGALSGRVIKYVAVDPAYEGEGLAARVVSRLIEEACALGRTHLFLYTRPENAPTFEHMGFSLVARAEEAALFETGDTRVEDYARALAKTNAALAGAEAGERGAAGSETTDAGERGAVGAVVMNANPFTLGHAHLIKVAAARVKRLNVFVVGEDASEFPYEARLLMVRAGAAAYPNVIVREGSDYVLSRATFPAYFLRDASRAARAQARLDVNLFAARIAPALGVNARFAGEEPLSASTRVYNEAMRDILPKYGIEAVIIERLCSGGAPVSASRARALLGGGDIEAARALLPECTRAYLDTDAGRAVVARLRERARA